MKKLIAIALAFALLLTLAACGGGSSEKTLDIAAFTQSVLDTVEYDDELIELSENALPHYYTLPDGVEEYKIYVSATSGTANELAVFKCKDSSAVTAVKEAVDARIETQRTNYENYVPAEIGRIDNALVKTSGNYVLFSVSADNETVEKLFDEAMK